MRRTILAASAALALIVGMSQAVAQDGQGQGQGEGGRRGGGQGQQLDPEQMRGRMMDALRERLGASEEDWQALQPKVERVLAAQQGARAGGLMGMMGGGGGRGGMGGGGAGGGGGGAGGAGGGIGRGGPEAEPTPLMTAGRELRDLLQDEAAAPEAIKEKLDAFRAARKTAQTELDAARADLQGLVTVRQEATLVAMGMLE